MKRYYIDKLKDALAEILKSNGVNGEQAEILTNSLLLADMRGVHTHGVCVLPAYLNKLKKNEFNLTDDVAILKQTAAFAVADAKNLLGTVSARKCMELAIDKASEAGIYTVLCRRANTLGAAFEYVKMATDRGMIGMCLSNSPSAMAAWGGNEKILGTNPLAIGIPALNSPPILIDMATSVVAKSKISQALRNGERIPLGWALDEQGNPTTDPAEAIRGTVLPMAEHKGYAIALAIDVLAGVLSGAGYLSHVNRFYSDGTPCMNVGHCFVAIDPEMVLGEDFRSTIDEYIAELKASGDNVYYPGEMGNTKMAACADGAVELTAETVESLSSLLREYGAEGALIEYGNRDGYDEYDE